MDSNEILESSSSGLAAFDAIAGWLTGASSLSIPFIGSFLIAGPIKEAFQDHSPDAQTITDVLTGLKIPEFEAMVYEALLSEHKILIAANTKTLDQHAQVSELMADFGAIIVSSSKSKPKAVPISY